MKRVLFLVVAGVFIFSGCRYEEGSALTFKKVEKRIKGMWSVSTIYKNGEKTDTESPTIVESKHARYEFFKSRILLIGYTHNNIECRSSGSWDFKDNKKILEVTLMNQYYPITRNYEIIKFKNKELKVRFTDDEGVVWTLVLSLEQSYEFYDV